MLRFSIVITLLILSKSTLASVTAAAGAPVTDVGSYSYYVKQIEKLAEQTDKINKLVSFSKLTKQGVDQVVGGVIGNYNNTVDLVSSINKLKSNIDYFPDKLKKQWEKELGQSHDVVQPFIDMDKYFIRNHGKDDYKSAYYRELVRDRAAQQIAIRASKNLENARHTLDEIKRLHKRIEQTKSIKESSDLQNEMMAMMLLLLEKMSHTQEQLAQLEGINEYKAISERKKNLLTKYIQIKDNHKSTWGGESRISKKESFISAMEKRARAQCETTKRIHSDYKCAYERREERGG